MTDCNSKGKTLSFMDYKNDVKVRVLASLNPIKRSVFISSTCFSYKNDSMYESIIDLETLNKKNGLIYLNLISSNYKNKENFIQVQFTDSVIKELNEFAN
jgi:hypothetical protein